MTPHWFCLGDTPGHDASSGRRSRTSVSWFKARRPTASRSPSIVFQSALWESNPPRQLGRLAPLPLGQGHARRKGRESNPQGSSLDRFRGGCHRQLACPSVLSKGCGGRNRTCVGAVNSRLPVPARVPPQSSQSGRPDLNRRSRAPATNAVGARGIPGFPTSCSARAPSGS